MKKEIEEEYKKFEEIVKNSNKQLSALVIADIMASMIKITKNEKDEAIKDYSDFDELVSNMKETLNSLENIPLIDLKQSLKDDVDSIKKMEDECMYSMRTLNWILEDVLKDEDIKEDE